jgi:hypothetical protein
MSLTQFHPSIDVVYSQYYGKAETKPVNWFEGIAFSQLSSVSEERASI